MEKSRRSYRHWLDPEAGRSLKTSAQVIGEARAAIAMASTRRVDTKRPFTPQEGGRILFPDRKVPRPPSSFSLRHVRFLEAEGVKLPPLKASQAASRRLPTRRLPKLASSLGNLPEELEAEQAPTLPIQREIHSSPSPSGSVSGQRHSAALRGRLGLGLGLGLGLFPNGLLTNVKRPRRSSKPAILEEDAAVEPVKPERKAEPRPFPTPNAEVALGGGREARTLDTADEENLLNERKQITKIRETTQVPVAEKKRSLQDVLAAIGKTPSEEAVLLVDLMAEAEGMLREESPAPKLQSQVMRALRPHLEAPHDHVLLRISRLMLCLRVSGQNLSAVTKLVFKVSRNDKNDPLFSEGHFLELFVDCLGRASPLEDAEALIYGYGSLKFLTMNKELLLVCLKLGILELMVLHLKIVNNARLELVSVPERTSHAMFQLTGTLRNVASEEATLGRIVETGAIAQLCAALRLFSADIDLVSNIARTLSIVSTHGECCESVVECEGSLRTLIQVLSKYPGRQDIVVRLAYAMGNVVAKSEAARVKLYREQGSMSVMLSLLESYLDRDLESSGLRGPGTGEGIQSPEWASDGSVEDVIVKIIRIIANMSMHPEVGLGMTCLPPEDPEGTGYAVDRHNARDGGRFMDILLTVLRRKSAAESEELVMSTLTTLNNLSYFARPQVAAEGPFALRQIEIAQVLSTLLLTKNEESMIEATRVLGNLTRSKDVRDYILEIGGISQLTRCLEFSNPELRFTTTGVLVNLMSDWDKRLAFKESGGVMRLISVLAEAEGRWEVGELACQALWNFTIDSTHLYAALGTQPTNLLLSVLLDLLDEERLFGISEGSEVPDVLSDSEDYKRWEDFALVATNLLEKIEQYMEAINEASAKPSPV